jgi:hypothetical protein
MYVLQHTQSIMCHFCHTVTSSLLASSPPAPGSTNTRCVVWALGTGARTEMVGWDGVGLETRHVSSPRYVFFSFSFLSPNYLSTGSAIILCLRRLPPPPPHPTSTMPHHQQRQPRANNRLPPPVTTTLHRRHHVNGHQQ